jgi:stage II sporulation protein D
MKTHWALGTLLLALLSGTAAGQSAEAAVRAGATLRVGLWTLWHDQAVTVSQAGESAATMRTCESCSANRLTHPATIRAAGSTLTVSGGRQASAVLLAGPVTLAAHGETLTLSNPVRTLARNGELVLAVTLPVESYVERVVASESGAEDSEQSLRALAIVVRSFALHEAHGHAEYDLCDSTHCQLLHWAGNSERRAAAHAAALATAGETLWFHGQRAEAWFHQNCGGRTASPGEVWPAAAKAGQIAGKAMLWPASRIDPYCTAGGAREWSASLSRDDLSAALAAQGLARPGWTTLTVARRGESGRAATLLADSTEISAEDFRLAVGRALGWGKILSTWFEVARDGDRFVFYGRGSGHGVGLCQAGAAAMAGQGRDSSQILAQYFPGAYAADEATGKIWQRLGGEGFELETLAAGDAAYLPEMNRAMEEAEGRSGLRPGDRITVRAFRTTPAFRSATLAPGWVAAFTEGTWIGTQPLATLAARKLLGPVLRHEFLHALVEARAGAKTPLWLREGLVEAWGGEETGGPAPALKLEEVDRALSHAASEAQASAAHRAAGWYAARLLERFGRAQVVEWLRTGVPGSAVEGLR